MDEEVFVLRLFYSAVLEVMKISFLPHRISGFVCDLFRRFVFLFNVRMLQL
jgi:hypothetical protein